MNTHRPQCPNCGGTLNGDGYTTPVSCEFANTPDGAEPDSGPYYCGFTEEEESPNG